jgi:uncharacterized protein
VIAYGPVSEDVPLLVLAHGAGAGERHPWMQRVAAALAERGVAVVTFEFPYMRAGRRLPDKGPILEASFREVWEEVLAGTGRAATCRFVGGKSMGGRIATQAAARGLFTPAPAGIVCFGYPLHPPAKPTVRRDAHLQGLTCPVLFVQGTRDPFGAPDEMHELSEQLPISTLHLVPAGDHSLGAPRRADPEGRSLEDAVDAAAEWMRGHMHG